MREDEREPEAWRSAAAEETLTVVVSAPDDFIERSLRRGCAVPGQKGGALARIAEYVGEVVDERDVGEALVRQHTPPRKPQRVIGDVFVIVHAPRPTILG